MLACIIHLYSLCGHDFIIQGGKTLSWERVAGRSPDGCGAVPGRTWYRPLTFRNRAFGPNRSGDIPSGRLIAAPTARSVHPGPPERRLFSLIRQGLRPCHLPRRGRHPPAGASLPNSDLPKNHLAGRYSSVGFFLGMIWIFLDSRGKFLYNIRSYGHLPSEERILKYG